jgi:hypothetical protein
MDYRGKSINIHGIISQPFSVVMSPILRNFFPFFCFHTNGDPRNDGAIRHDTSND